MGGRVRLNWDERVEMSTNAHHVLFNEFLSVSGLFDRFVEESPLVYTSNNAPAKRDVLGIVDGAKRFNYADAAQLGVYMAYYRKQEMQSDDNPPIGILLWASRGSEINDTRNILPTEINDTV